MPTFTDRIKKSWNVFIGRETAVKPYDLGYSSSMRPDRPRLSRGNERSFINFIYNRIAVDVALVNIRHVDVDQNDRYLNDRKSSLNDVLTTRANLDQTGRAFIQDAVVSMCDEGCVALVPIETSEKPNETGGYNIYSMRTAKIVEWYPRHVKVNVYNEWTGKRQDKILEKENVAIIENPFYSIMNEPNSTLQRLIRVLNDIDRTNEHNSANKMDIIIQLPYLAHSEKKKEQAEERRKALENQLSGNAQYGIGYIDSTEKVVQLNRSIENNLWQQATDLKQEVYNQLGLTEDIFNGKANEQTMLDYYTRTIEPFLIAITEELQRKFITKTARTQGQRIKYFREPFKLVPINNIADIADKLNRNEILSSNEIRSIIGFKPDNNPKSDALVNSNMPFDQTGLGIEGMQVDEQGNPISVEDSPDPRDEIMEEMFSSLEEQINDIIENFLNDQNEELKEEEE